MTVYVISEESEHYRHLPNAKKLTSFGHALTLCGWCDVSYSEEDGIPDCPSCLTIVDYCKKLRIPKAEKP